MLSVQAGGSPAPTEEARHYSTSLASLLRRQRQKDPGAFWPRSLAELVDSRVSDRHEHLSQVPQNPQTENIVPHVCIPALLQ